MNKNIKDYLHLYMGCNFRYRYVDYEPGVWAIGASLTPKRYERVLGDAAIDGIQLLLRPLSDITEAEIVELIMCTIPDEIEDKPTAADHDIEMFYNDGGTMVDDDVAVGCNYSCICFEGQLIIRKEGSVHFFDEAGEAMNGYNMPNVYTFLLSNHFDLFHLIESGLALDARKLAKEKINSWIR